MATPPTFTTGSVLTAAQMNTIGMHLIKSQAVSAGGTTVNVDNVFNADYDRYRIHMRLNGSTAGTWAHFRLRNSGGDLIGSNYYRMGRYAIFSGGGLDYNSGPNTSFQVVGQWGGSLPSTCIMEIFDPYLANRTGWFANTNDVGGGAAYFQMGLADVTTSYTGFTVYCQAGTFNAGSIKVYGYRD